MKNFEVAETRPKFVNESIDYSIKEINRRLGLKLPLNDKGVLLKSYKLNSRANVKMLKFLDGDLNPTGGFMSLQLTFKRINSSHIEYILKKDKEKLV